MSHSRSRGKRPQPQPPWRERGNQYPRDTADRNYWDNEERGRQFGSSWRSGISQREPGNRDWVSGVGQSDYRGTESESGYRGQRGRQHAMGTWGSEGGGGWSNSETGRPSFAGRGPQGYRRSDERIMEDINEELTWDDEIDATDITVEAKNGEVILKGFVIDRQSKRRAEEIVESCVGVKDV